MATEQEASLFNLEFWGASRHELIADAASRLISAATQAKVAALTSGLDDPSLKGISTWADEIKGRKSTDAGLDPDTKQFLKDFPNDASKTWHYVDMPLGSQSYAEAKANGFTRDDDVVQTLVKAIRVFGGGAAPFSKLNALRWIVHLTGDIHQPVHCACGYLDKTVNPPAIVSDPAIIKAKGFGDDRGGNQLILPISGKPSLHSYWDSSLPGTIDNGGAPAVAAASEQLAPPLAYADAVEKLVGLVKKAGAAKAGVQSAAAVAPPPADQLPELWASGSLAQAREAYRSISIASVSGQKYLVSWEGKAAYEARCRPIVSTQMTLAARRLADLLDAIL